VALDLMLRASLQREQWPVTSWRTTPSPRTPNSSSVALTLELTCGRHACWPDSANLKMRSTGGYQDAPQRPTGSALR
jgi:hypothetical protein